MTQRPRTRQRARRGAGGFTLVEIAIVVALIGLLAGLSLTSYMGYVEKARVVRAIAEIQGMSRVLDGIVADEDASLPDTLADTEIGTPVDPWGNPYRYLRIVLPGGVDPPTISQARKDAFLVPINSDYDLYSSGPDGASLAPLQSPVSRDDVVRANDGGYVGIAVRY